MTKTIDALKLAEEALRMISTFQEEDNQCDNGYGAAYVANEALAAIREARAEQEKQEPEWPHGATVKLRWAGYGPYPEGTGWAKRGKNGELVTAYSLNPLDESKWEVIEERTAPQPKQEKQEPVAIVDAYDDGYWADILPDRDVKVGQLLYAATVSVEAAVLAEREACAKVCESLIDPDPYWDSSFWDQACYRSAAAIRARGKK